MLVPSPPWARYLAKDKQASGSNGVDKGLNELVDPNGVEVKSILPAGFVATLALAASVGSSAVAQPKPAMQHFLPDVKIDQCFVTPPKLMSKNASGTQIVYENIGARTYTTVTFVVGYRNAANNFLRKVTDTGKFAPGAKINQHFPLYSDVTYAGKATSSCGAITATR